jgi:hypothetical protein
MKHALDHHDSRLLPAATAVAVTTVGAVLSAVGAGGAQRVGVDVAGRSVTLATITGVVAAAAVVSRFLISGKSPEAAL